MSIDSLFSAIQEECLPGIWSKGVALSREKAVVEDSSSPGELKFRIRMPGRPVSPRVTLWPEDEDSYCDCGEKVEPCAHIAAAIIALKGGLVVQAEAATLAGAASSAAILTYRFTRKDGALHFERVIVRPAGETRLTQTLVSYTGGITSGRIQASPVPATQGDYAADAALGTATHGALPAPALARLLRALEDCSHLSLDGQPVRCSGKPTGLRARLSDENGGFRLRVEQDATITEVFSNGAALCGDQLRPVAMPSLTEEERSLFRPEGRFFGSSEGAHLASTLVPSLESKLPLAVETRRLPRLVRVPPRIVLKTQEIAGDLIVTPVLLYDHGPGEVPARDPAAEHALTRKLQGELNLRPDQPARFSGDAAVRFRMSLKDWEVEGTGKLRPRLTYGADGRFDLVYEKDDGSAPLPHDWFERFGPRLQRLLAARDAEGKVPAALRPELARAFEDLGEPVPQTLSRLRKALDTFQGIPAARLPADLRAELREYQKKGVDWLSFLRDSELGALLADDMGLGKTLQAICALRGRALVVTPTSVLSSWAEQLARFRPGLRVSLYYGPERAIAPQAGDGEPSVTLTTYAVLRLDQERIAAERWDTIVLDEAQTIRNPESQVSRAAHRLDAPFRICLSGTPVENRLDDLWSQFRFLNPGLLGDRGGFQSLPPEELRARIKPFILRRLKREVAPELPPRTETVLHCELSAEERALYGAVLASTRSEVLAKLGGDGKPNILAALEALLRLRQAACHPALVPGQSAATSTKLELLLDTLDESTAEGHRSLVFSQWTSFLDLIEPKLREHGISYLRLDGSTPNRQEIVSRFQAPGGPAVLLLSLKAGGVGLTLTAADHVFLLDPWWNPAAEDQAADRAHRIGQENPVLIHRLVARDTVEERILELQKRKLDLAAAVLSESGGALGLTREDLLGLLY